MGVYLADQTLTFLNACLLGGLFGLLYDAFRISRIALPTPSAVVFAEDLLFWIVCAVSTFLFLLSSVDGAVRVFALIGMVLGAVLYNLTPGRLVMRVSRTIIHIVQSILRFIFRWILYLIWRLCYLIVSLFLRPLGFLQRIVKKSVRRVKFRLKVRRHLVYNHFIGSLGQRFRKGILRESKDGEREKRANP